MTSRAVRLPNRWTRWGRKLQNTWRSFVVPGDISTLLITAVLLVLPALALVDSGWPLSARVMIPALLTSVFFGYLLARSQYGELLSLMVSTIYGVCFILLYAALNDPGGLAAGLVNVFSRVSQWLIDALSGGINQDELVFTLVVSGLLWFMGYNLAWHVFRVDRVWRAILPPALVLISNAVYAAGENQSDRYLVLFMFLVLLLVVRSSLDAREWDWYSSGIRVPRKLRQQVFRIGAVVALLVLLVAWVIPSADLQERLDRFQQFLQAEPLVQISEFWNRLFASVDTQGPATADYYGGDSLQLGGAIRLGDQVVFLASAPQGRRYYWRSRVYDNYDSGRWTSAADTRLTDPEAPLEIALEPMLPGARVPVRQEFVVNLNATRILYTAPQPAQIDLPTRTDLRYTPDRSMNISVVRPLSVLYRGDSYSATSLMTNADATQLRAAGTDYPQWVRDTYSSYIPSATPRTIQLASQIVAEAGAVTPYDQAKAIETWLRANITYNEIIPAPPAGQDAVDWVLFDLREGYCNYYASAMIVMLRSLNVPARMAAGFAQGEWNELEGAFVVKERDAHTWVEVYFPGYGWVEFEPTAIQAPVNRGDDLPPPLAPTETPPTATPTFTPSPTPSPTAPPPLVDQAEGVENPVDPPTATLTYTPTPTPTPVIIPTQPPPLRPEPRGPLSFILPALGIALLGLLIVALVIVLLLFIYWWWEWRGMKGLSPISRAYARLERYIPLIGIRTTPEQTPDERRQTIVRELPVAEPPVTAITRMYTAERYGPRQPKEDVESPQELVADDAWSDARGSILSRFFRRRLMPWRKRD